MAIQKGGKMSGFFVVVFTTSLAFQHNHYHCYTVRSTSNGISFGYIFVTKEDQKLPFVSKKRLTGHAHD